MELTTGSYTFGAVAVIISAPYFFEVICDQNVNISPSFLEEAGLIYEPRFKEFHVNQTSQFQHLVQLSRKDPII